MKKQNVCFTEGSWVGKYLIFASKLRFINTAELPPLIKFSAISKPSRSVRSSISALQT